MDIQIAVLERHYEMLEAEGYTVAVQRLYPKGKSIAIGEHVTVFSGGKAYREWFLYRDSQDHNQPVPEGERFALRYANGSMPSWGLTSSSQATQAAINAGAGTERRTR